MPYIQNSIQLSVYILIVCFMPKISIKLPPSHSSPCSFIAKYFCLPSAGLYCHPVVRETYRNDLEKVNRLVSSFFPTHTPHTISLSHSHFSLMPQLFSIQRAVMQCETFLSPAVAAQKYMLTFDLLAAPTSLNTLSFIWRRRRSCAATQRTGAN